VSDPLHTLLSWVPTQRVMTLHSPGVPSAGCARNGCTVHTSDWRARPGTAANHHGVRAERHTTIAELATRRWHTSALVSGYVVTRDGIALPASPRVAKDALPWLRSQGLDVHMTCLIADVDTPGHLPWTAETRGEFEALWASAPSLATCGLYLSPKGYRLLQPLRSWLPVDEAEPRLRAWLRQLVAEGAWESALECHDWGHLMRVPRSPDRDSERIDLSRLRAVEPPAAAAPVPAVPRGGALPRVSARAPAVVPTVVGVPAEWEAVADALGVAIRDTVTRDWRRCYLAISGALCALGCPLEVVPEIVARAHLVDPLWAEYLSDRVTIATTTTAKWASGHPVTGAGVLHAEYPAVADALLYAPDRPAAPAPMEPRPDPAAAAARARIAHAAPIVGAWRALGYLAGVPDARGWTTARCPREARHSSGRDDVCAVHEATGAAHCADLHERGPERGTADTGTLARWLVESHPAAAEAVAHARDNGTLHAVTTALSLPPPGETPRRVVPLDGLADDMTEVFERAQRLGRAVLYTPTAGAGKSHAIGRAISPLVAAPRASAAAPMAGGSTVVATRAELPTVALSVLSAGRAVRVSTPAHLVVDATGALVCRKADDMTRVYLAGGSARASGCPDCEHRHGCVARDAWVPWRLDGAGGARAESWHVPPPGEAWVAISTHASPAPTLRGSPLVVDESDPALTPITAALEARALVAAQRWAGAILVSALSWISTAIVSAVGLATVRAIAGLPAPDRGPWLEARVAEYLDGCTPAVRETIRSWATADDSAACDDGWTDDADGGWAAVIRSVDTTDALASAVVARWITRATRPVGVIPRKVRPRAATASVAAESEESARDRSQRGARALQSLARWASGCHARWVDDDDGGALLLAWRSPAAEAARQTLARGGGVLLLDATGDPAIARGAIGAELVDHDPVVVLEAADVRRVLVHTHRAGRRALAPRRGTVDWTRHRLPALQAALGALQSGWRDGYGVGTGLVVCARPLALACAAIATGLEPEAAVAEACTGQRITSVVRAGVLAWVTAATDDVRRVVAAFGDARWTHYGGSETRGSNVHSARSWVATIGDHRVPRESARSALWAQAGDAPDDDGCFAAMDSGSSRAVQQAHDRLRTVRRAGEQLLAVHVGAVPPIGWHQLPERPVVVTGDAARQIGAAPVVVVAAEPVASRRPDSAGAPSPVAPLVLHRLHDAGWTMADVHRAAGVTDNATKAWWRGKAVPRAEAHSALVQLLEGRGAPIVGARLRRLLEGRAAAVWALLPGLDTPAIRAWVDTGRHPPGATDLAALAAAIPSLGTPRRATPSPQAFGDAGDGKRYATSTPNTTHAKEAYFMGFASANSPNYPYPAEIAKETLSLLSVCDRGGVVTAVAVTKRLPASVSLAAPSATGGARPAPSRPPLPPPPPRAPLSRRAPYPEAS
jgi:hypothetical protein